MERIKPAEISKKFLRAKKQAGFTRTNFLFRQKDLGGFIPMIIMILLILGLIIWFVYSRVSSSN